MSLERIEITPFAVIVGDVVQQRRTGYLTIVRAPMRRELYWSQGELVLLTSAAPQDSLGEFLVRKGVLSGERAVALAQSNPTDVVSRFHESGVLELGLRQTLLREWISSQFIPLFSLDEGTAAFTEATAIEPEKRVFLQSTAAAVLEGIRSITNGLVLRRSLGDLKRVIGYATDSRWSIDALPLNDTERRVAMALETPSSIEAFLKHFNTESVAAARTVIAMLTLGVFAELSYESRAEAVASMDDMQRDLALLAAIGSNDQRSLRAVAYSRQIASLDHYQLLEVPRAAARQQIGGAAEALKRRYDPASYPPVVRDSIQAIHRRIDEALITLNDASRRKAYDKLLSQRGGGPGTAEELQKRLAQRSIAQQNYAKARELSVAGDYYGAIILLKQAVQFTPDHADSWYLLGSCQERNPKWRREAAENFQRALSIDPNHVDALISLGDLYRSEGLTSRAQSCYEDVLKIAPENQQALSRLTALRKR